MTDHNIPDPADLSPAATDPSDPPDAVQAADPSEELRRERDDYYDRWVRKTAEFDNYRRRIERERREQAEQAVVSLMQDLLLVVDDFDRALTVVEAGVEGDAYRKGVELIHQKLHDLLRKRGVRPIHALGADFDPNVHQAVMHEVSTEHREGEVIGEMQKGYTMGERLLRPAMVKVAKA
jgi:molecular chaperone GrpE